MDLPVSTQIFHHTPALTLCVRVFLSLMYLAEYTPVGAKILFGDATCTQELGKWHSLHSKKTVSLHSRWWMCECINAVFPGWHNIVHFWEYTCASTREAILWHPASWQQLLLQRSPQDYGYCCNILSCTLSCKLFDSTRFDPNILQRMFDSNSIHHGTMQKKMGTKDQLPSNEYR